MLHVRTGRYCYELKAKDADELKRTLLVIHERMIAFAKGVRSEARCPEAIRSRMEKVIDGSSENVDAIVEAVSPLDDERKALMYVLIQQRMVDAFEIACATGKIEVARMRAQRTLPMRAKRHPQSAAIAAAIAHAAVSIGPDVPKRAECIIAAIEKSAGQKVSKRTVERALKKMRRLTDGAMSSVR